jgi:hypothetical protein
MRTFIRGRPGAATRGRDAVAQGGLHGIPCAFLDQPIVFVE